MSAGVKWGGVRVAGFLLGLAARAFSPGGAPVLCFVVSVERLDTTLRSAGALAVRVYIMD